MKLKYGWITLIMLLGCMSSVQAAETYDIDIKGQHAFIHFKVKHLGYSWLMGEFRHFQGSFTFDDKHPEHDQVNVIIDSNSIDTNHAERNKHLRSDDFFAVTTYPKITFVSTSYESKDGTKGILHGDLTLRGVTKNVAIAIQQVGTGNDPWGGYRRGFEGHTTLHLSDYHMPFAPKLGPVSENVELFLSVEGIRRK